MAESVPYGECICETAVRETVRERGEQRVSNASVEVYLLLLICTYRSGAPV